MEQVMFCSHCGILIESRFLFCPYCGMEIRREIRFESSVEPPASARTADKKGEPVWFGELDSMKRVLESMEADLDNFLLRV